ncbi:MAG: aminomethyl-transferring glycine dehydrogenase subunit GcvPA [Halobacteriaceae archaeon]
MTGDANPYVSHDATERAAMLDAVGVDSVAALFDVPESVRFDGDFGIPSRDERTVRAEVRNTLGENADVTEFLGRGHYAHYVPAVVDDCADRSEFLTSYTQYQPEIAQGFLQALFEYQSLLVELTGLDVANASVYDAATALGEAALMADRVRATDGDTVFVPETLREERRAVLDTYVAGPALAVETYPTEEGTADVGGLRESLHGDAILVYAETPTVRGCVEPALTAVGDAAEDAGALFCVGSDPIALSLLERPADAGADVVVGDAGVLGLGASFGTGLGMFATREAFLRQVPGRLVGASEDAGGRRAYTLTLQTREQHIRRERATSNICTNQAHLALRAAVHAAWLGPEGLTDLAERCVELPRDLAAAFDAVEGVTAPVDDRHPFREFVAETDRPADAVADDLLEAGYAVHAVDDHEIQVCVTEVTEGETEGLVAALTEVA